MLIWQVGKDYSDLANWYIKKDGNIFKNDLRPLVHNLDILPFADRGLMPNNYVNFVMTNRGCPYNCTYCLNAAYNRLYRHHSAQIRQRSVDNVIEELKRIKAQFPHTFIGFLDTILPVSKEWTENFSRKYRKHIGLPFFCNIKAEITDKETINLLRYAGCHSVGVGIESSNEEIRKKLMRRRVSNKQLVKVSNWIHEAHIKLNTFNILGMPKTTFSDDVKTIKFNCFIKADFAEASLLSPYKGSEIYDMAKTLNLLHRDSRYARSKFTFYTIDYGSKLLRRKLINLQSLYPVLTKYPFLVRHLDSLTALPLEWLYSKLFSFWAATVFRWEIFPPYWLRVLKRMSFPP